MVSPQSYIRVWGGVPTTIDEQKPRLPLLAVAGATNRHLLSACVLASF